MASKRSRDTDGFLPLTPAMFHVLLALADGEKHGYAVLKEVPQRTNGKVRLSAGTLYGIIHRLLAEGMIMRITKRPDASIEDERRRYYRLTDFGRRVAVAEAKRMDAILGMARDKNILRSRSNRWRRFIRNEAKTAGSKSRALKVKGRFRSKPVGGEQ